MSARPWPLKLVFRRKAQTLSIVFDDGQSFNIPFELLRVESPSAEVQGHGPHRKKLIVGKSRVDVTTAEPVGRYAVRLQFDDGHNSGIYSWDYLRVLGEHRVEMMRDYKARMENAGLTR